MRVIASALACDALAATQASPSTLDVGDTKSTVIPEAPHSTASTSTRATKAATRNQRRADHTSASTRRASTRSHAHANERTTHAQPALRSARHAKKNDKTHPRVRSVQRVSTPAREKADASDAPGGGAIAPAGDPAMTSSGSWRPSSVAEPNDNIHSRTGSLFPAGAAAVNKGRGEAH